MHTVEKERTRICINADYHLPITIEEDGKTVERTSRLERLTSMISAEAVVAKYLRQNHRFMDADDDISPDVD